MPLVFAAPKSDTENSEIEILRAELAQTREALAEANDRLYRYESGSAQISPGERDLRSRIFDSDVVGVIHWNLDTRLITDANDLFLQMTGYSREELEAGKLNWYEMTPPEWRERNEAGVREIHETGASRPYEKEYFRRDGSRVPIIIGGARFEGAASDGVSFILDISERKKTESALRESEQRFRMAAEAAHGVVYDWNLHTKFLYRSPGLYDIIGFRPEEVEPTREWWIERIHPEDSRRLAQSAQESFAKRQRHTIAEYRVRHRDGHYIYVLDKSQSEFDAEGNLVRLVGNRVDISEQRRTEQALLESEALYRTLATTTSTIIWTAAPDGEMSQPSPTWEAFTGQKAEEYVRNSGGLEAIHPDDRSAALKSLIEAVEKKARWDSAYRLWHHSSQTYRHMTVYAVPILEAAGAVTQWVGMMTDVQERWEYEEELRREQAEKDELNLRLRRAMQETHHRIKNNLQVVSALVELQNPPGEMSDPALERIRLHVRNLAAIHDLLTIQAREDVELSEVSVRDVLNRLIPMLEETSGGRILRAQIDDFVLPVREAASLALLVSECVSNAIKHSKGAIDITLRVGVRDATLQICDNGDGFPPDFDPVKNAHTGLELIDNTVRWDLHGDVHFDNQERGGARVTVIFPLISPLLALS